MGGYLMSYSKFIGGVLLIVGTSIGGGMLALPVATAAVGITHAVFFLFFCWLIMTAGALLVLEVNLRLPIGSNMVSMAKTTLGLPGQIIAWITYLFLLYTLLSAYISGGSDVFHDLLHKAHIELSTSITALLFTSLFSFVIYSGIRAVDYVNRAFMFGKLGIYLLLLAVISPYITVPSWHEGSFTAIRPSIMILITSFGFASIVPSLRDYFNDDIATLRNVIIWGSLLPLICYILWETVIMGVIPHQTLLTLRNSDHATSGLTEALRIAVHSQWITGFFGFFTSICMVTAFLGVSLGLFDFLADGLQLKKGGHQGKLILILTFLPPLAVVLTNPGIYLHALSYAGTCCVILLLLLPTIMAWQGRKKDTSPAQNIIFVPGGSISLFCLAIIAVSLLLLNGS